jgi:aryl-alcohol dehydrogenase-like predicted oxidoreductase
MPLGIASSYGTDEAMLQEAVAHGVNYLYWGTLRTRKMAAGIRAVARRNRSDIIIVVHTMARKTSTLERIVHKSLKTLSIDYIDVLLLGMVMRKSTSFLRLIDRAHQFKDKGLVRAVAVSSHRRSIFKDLETGRLADIIHVRYNAAHRSAEDDVFAHLPEPGGPGVVTFTNTRWMSLINPATMPSGETPPSAVDCYRFVLSHPQVHVAVSGPSTMEQLKENLKVIELGPLNTDELARMRRLGDYVYQQQSPLSAQLRGTIRSFLFKPARPAP